MALNTKDPEADDGSALQAILEDEPQREHFNPVIEAAGEPRPFEGDDFVHNAVGPAV